MRIGIDIRCLTDGKRTGVEEYTINILQEIFEQDQENTYILFLNAFHKSYFDPRIFAQYKNVEVKQFRFPNKLLNLFLWYFRWPHADKLLGGVDVFFMPNINFIALSKKTKLVLTIHDLSFELCPETFSLKRRLWHHFINPRQLCRRADAIVAVSQSTRQDIHERYQIPLEKITKIYNGVSEEFNKLDRNDPRLIEVKEKYHLPFNFIFFLGTIEPRKNIQAIVRAYDQLRSLHHPQLDKYKLVLAGGKGWKTEEIFAEARNARFTQDILYINGITNEDKAAVFTLASLFVYPSQFEGFGIPLLEAMKCGVPVITSNSSAMPEVVEDAAIMIDPDRPDELFLAMKEVLLDRQLQEALNEKAWRQSFKFNWRASARSLLQLFGSNR